LRCNRLAAFSRTSLIFIASPFKSIVYGNAESLLGFLGRATVPIGHAYRVLIRTGLVDAVPAIGDVAQRSAKPVHLGLQLQLSRSYAALVTRQLLDDSLRVLVVHRSLFSSLVYRRKNFTAHAMQCRDPAECGCGSNSM